MASTSDISNTYQPTFSIRVKLYAIYQEVIGQTELTLEITSGTTVDDLCDRLSQDYPALVPWKSQTRYGVNFQFVRGDTPLNPDDEVVFIPPVSGG